MAPIWAPHKRMSFKAELRQELLRTTQQFIDLVLREKFWNYKVPGLRTKSRLSLKKRPEVPADPSRRNCPSMNQCIINHAINDHTCLVQLIFCEHSENLGHFFLGSGWQSGCGYVERVLDTDHVLLDHKHANHDRWIRQVQRKTKLSPGIT